MSAGGWVSERLELAGRSVHYRRSMLQGSHVNLGSRNFEGIAPAQKLSDGQKSVPIVHIHGFAISGEYLMPTARLLARRWVNVVPDLPGYGHSERRDRVLDIPALAAALVAILDELGIDQAVLVGNSMGCPIGLEVAHAAPERVHRLVLVSPAGGVQNQPLARALGQLGKDMFRESPRMFPVAVPDYVQFGPLNGLRLFRELTLFPSLERLVHTPVPTLAVLGVRDPLMPTPARVREVASLSAGLVAVALIDEAAHAVNFSHPVELAATIEAWLDGELTEHTPLAGVRVFLAHDESAD